MSMVQTFKFDESGKVSEVKTSGAPAEKSNPEIVHNCPRCGSYFYGRFEGFDGNPFFCGSCGYTYPTISMEALRAMHEKNGTLAKFDAGEMVEEVGNYEIKVS